MIFKKFFDFFNNGMGKNKDGTYSLIKVESKFDVWQLIEELETISDDNIDTKDLIERLQSVFFDLQQVEKYVELSKKINRGLISEYEGKPEELKELYIQQYPQFANQLK